MRGSESVTQILLRICTTSVINSSVNLGLHTRLHIRTYLFVKFKLKFIRLIISQSSKVLLKLNSVESLSVSPGLHIRSYLRTHSYFHFLIITLKQHITYNLHIRSTTKGSFHLMFNNFLWGRDPLEVARAAMLISRMTESRYSRLGINKLNVP